MTRAVAEAIGADRVGIRISPAHNIQGVLEEDEAFTRATYETLVDGIKDLDLAYLSILADPRSPSRRRPARALRRSGDAQLRLRVVTDIEDVESIIDEDLGDRSPSGREFLANPDLAERWRTGAELNEPDQATFYGGGAEGYTDYPTLGER